MYKFKFIVAVLLLLVANNAFAQDKYEKESRIKLDEVPSKARLFIDSLKFDTKEKWYKEEGLDRISIEAKFNLNRARYSIEFDTLGTIEDIEIEVKWNSLNENLKDLIVEKLNQDCSDHKVVKVQRQFTGSENNLFLQLKSGKAAADLTIKYELIVRCKNQNGVDLFEFLFDEEGTIVSKSKIVFKNSSHLEY